VTMLYIGRPIILPLIFSLIIAVVLHPVVRLFARRKLPRVAAIAIVLFLSFVVIAGLGNAPVYQASRFSQSLPTLVENLTRLINQAIAWRPNVWASTRRASTTGSPAQGWTHPHQQRRDRADLVTLGSGVVTLTLIPCTSS